MRSADGERLMSWQVQESFTTAPRLLPLQQQFRPTFYRPDGIGCVLFEGASRRAGEGGQGTRQEGQQGRGGHAALLPQRDSGGDQEWQEPGRTGRSAILRAMTRSLLVLDGRALNAKPEIKRGKGPTEYTPGCSSRVPAGTPCR